MGRYSSQSPRLERKIKTSGFETGSIAFGQEWGCSKRCSTSGYLVKKIISFQKMQIVSYLPSALSAETNIILFDSIRPRSRTMFFTPPTPALAQLAHKRYEL